MTVSQLSNPFSTGGGGDQFEKSVGSFYLVALLAEDIPRGLNQGITKHVKFQQRYAGAIIDDIVVVSESANGQEFKLALQVKHGLTFTKANKLFRRVTSDCWQMFTNSAGWNFGPDMDRLGIAFGAQPPTRIEHLQRALDWARTASSADDYFTKLRTPQVASDDMRHYVDDVFWPVLSDVAGRDLTDDEVFRFLRCLVILHFDLEDDVARDTPYVYNRLLDRLDERDETEARKLADRLFRLVVEYNKDAAGCDYRTLRDRLGNDFRLKERTSCQQDLDRLRRHTDLVLDRIITDIGGTVSLPRSQQVNDLCARIEQKGIRAIVIVGEPGTGKSALMKLVADHLRQENEVIVTEVDRLRGPSFESFLEMLRIEQPLDRLLAAMSSGPLRCLFIDQLERVRGDEERCRVLGDLVRAIRRFNEQVLANGGHDDSCWRVVLTCRKEEFRNSLRNTVLVEYARQQALQSFDVEDLTEDEFQTVLTQFPRLSYLSNYERTGFLLKRPFYLNLLTRRENPLDEANLPEQLTETWFLKFFWEDVIRRGQPYHEREQALLKIVRDRLATNMPFTPATGLNSQALNSLISDQIVTVEEMGVRLAHDLFEDWVGERLIASEGDRLIPLWEQAIRPTSFLRSIELRALYHLEVNHNAEAWLTLTKSCGEVSPSWRDVAIGAIFKSELLAELLELTKPFLLIEDSALLPHVLRIMRTVYTKPSVFIRGVLDGAPESAEKDRYFSYIRDPIVSLWEPVLRFVLNNQDNIPLVALPEFSQACEMWLKTKGTPLRTEVARFCYSYLVQTFDEPLDDLAYEDDEILRVYSDLGTISEQARRAFTLALLFAADCVPNYVEALIREDLKQERPGLVQKLVLKDANWVVIGKHLPDLLVEAAERVLCWKPKPREYFEKLWAEPGPKPKSLRGYVKSEEEQYRRMCRYGMFGIHDDYDWNPITYNRGPFYLFLRYTESVVGTDCWARVKAT
ncbi:MAG: ATP-binding protein, partial [Anaerolineales bacterium]